MLLKKMNKVSLEYSALELPTTMNRSHVELKASRKLLTSEK